MDPRPMRPGLNPPRLRLPLATGLLTFVLGLLLALVMGAHQARLNLSDAQERFDTLSRQLGTDIMLRMQRFEYGLRGARGLVIAAKDAQPGREAFSRYSRTRDIDREFPGARGFGVIRRVPRADEPAFVAAARRDGWPTFAVKQLQPHDGERWVIEYVEPVDRNQAAIGLDVASEAGRREAALAAMRSGQATLTAPITLVQASGRNSRAFLLMLPMYRLEAPVATAEERERATLGWSYVPIEIDHVLRGLEHDMRHHTLALRDTGAAANGEILGQSQVDSPLVRKTTMPVFGRTWEAELRATPAFFESLHQTPPSRRVLEFTLLAAVCALLAGVVTAMLEHSRGQRLEQARRAAIVEGSDDAIVVQTLDGVITDWNDGAERLFGFPAAEALGRTATELLLPPGLEAQDAHILATVTRGERVKVFETLRRHRDGTLIEVSIAASPIRAPDGTCVGSAKILRDVREARRAEARVRELNASLEDQVRERTAMLEAARHDLQTVLDAMPSQIGYWDGGLRNRVANRAYHLWFGIDPSSVRGMHMRELLGPDRFEGSLPQALAALRGESQTFEESSTGPDGEPRHSLVHYLPDLLDGKVRGFYAFVHDVTELTESRLHLAKVQRDNAALLQTLRRHSIVSVADRSGRIIDVNEAFCRISGYSAEELIGQYHRVVNSGTHDRAFWQSMWATISSGKSWRAEVCNRARDGSLYWVDSVVAPFMNAEGEVEKYVSIRTDITDRKRTEIELQRTLALVRAMLDASTNVSIIAVDPAGLVSLFNKGAELLLGYTADEVIGRMDALQWHDRDELRRRAQALSQQLGRTVKTGRALVDDAALNETCEWTYTRKDGARIPVSMTVTKMEDSHGALIGYLGLAQDISARLEHERSLRAAMQKAREANQAKSEFLANMSHEIRTPMNAVIGLSYLLERTALDADQADMLARLNLAGKSLLDIINDVLDLSKIEAGEMLLEAAPFELPRLLRDIGSLMGVQAHQKGIAYTVEIDARLPRVVIGDSTRLRQVLMNLLSNAIKFTAEGSVTLKVAHEALGDGRMRARFEVSDTGIGIDPRAQSRLFEPFAQADASTTRRFGGTGLGLSIVRQLVRLMGGELSLDSALGAGSRFVVTLDLDASDAPPQDDTPHAAGNGPGLVGLSVLIVDDNPVNRDVARRILADEGAFTFTAGNGQQAIDALLGAASDVDAVLMDVQMPVLDGLDATRQIRGALGRVDLPVIGLTAGVSRSEQAQARAAGMDDVVGKPFDPHVLVTRLRRAVGRQADNPATSPDPTGTALPPDWPSLDGIDAADACRRLRGDTALFRTLLRRLAVDLAALGPQPTSMAQAGARLHDLKGTAGTLGAGRLRQLAGEAESACRAEDAEALHRLWPALCDESARLQRQLAGLTTPPQVGQASDAPGLDQLEQLQRLLAADDLAALPLFDSLRTALRARLGEAAFDALCRSIDDLDFTTAARELAAVEA